MTYTPEQIAQHIAQRVAAVGEEKGVRIIRQLVAERDDDPVCRCGQKLSKNPHPDCGKPFTLLEAGPVWVCIPCQSSKLHAWCERALAAESKIAAISTQEKVNDVL